MNMFTSFFYFVLFAKYFNPVEHWNYEPGAKSLVSQM